MPLRLEEGAPRCNVPIQAVLQGSPSDRITRVCIDALLRWRRSVWEGLRRRKRRRVVTKDVGFLFGAELSNLDQIAQPYVSQERIVFS